VTLRNLGLEFFQYESKARNLLAVRAAAFWPHQREIERNRITMRDTNVHRTIVKGTLAVLAFAAAPAVFAQPWVSFDDNTRYLALGDSLSAGYEAKPVTQGFVYQLYQNGAIDGLNNLLFCNQAVPGAASTDVLHYQIPQVHLFFADTGKSYRKVVTLTVGGNDLLALLGPNGIDPSQIPGVLTTYGSNLGGILASLASSFPDIKIYVGNVYDPKLPLPGEELLIAALNQVTASVAGLFPNNVVLVDVFAAFQGKSGLLLIERKGAGFNIHPTNAGYQVMTRAFSASIGGY
jgi:lysophospholipase L1-like esterase